MADKFKYVQNQVSQLAGAGVSIGDTSMTVVRFAQIDGTPLTMTNFGIKGYLTVQPGAGIYEEQISFTGIVANIDGTVTLTGISTVLNISPYTETSGFAIDHAGGVNFVVTNTAGFYNTFANKLDDETIQGSWTFNALADGANPKIDSNSYTFTNLDYITKGYADSQYLRTDGTNAMLADLDFGGFKGINLADATNPMDAVNLETLQAAVIGGGTPATTSQGGYVKVATPTEFTNTTDTTVVGPFTFYNMATISQIKSLGNKISIDTSTITFAAGGTYTIAIPGGILSTNNAIRFKLLINNMNLNSSDSVTITVSYGGTTIATATISQVGGGSSISSGTASAEGYIIALGATNSQRGYLNFFSQVNTNQGNLGLSDGLGSAAVDSTISQNLVITLSRANSGDGSIYGIIVEKIK